MWKQIQCTVRGRSHIKSDTPCQDRTYAITDGNTHVIALADGAGSATMSHYGAETATKCVCVDLAVHFENYFQNDDAGLVKTQLMKNIIDDLRSQAGVMKCDIKDLASTLLVAAVKGEKFILIHIGDGVIGYLDGNELKVASQPENGEFVNTTIFTTSKDAISTMKIIRGSIKNIRGFVLMSDGTEISLYNKREKRLASILKTIMDMVILIQLDALEKKLHHTFENVIRQNTTDDCGIAMLIKGNNDFKGYRYFSSVEKGILLQVIGRSAKKRIMQYDTILEFLTDSHSLLDVARHLHLKPRYAKKRLNRLCKLNLLVEEEKRYRTIVIMDSF